ncbi:hypothetical protein J8629_26635, partial [Serratia fonticola]|uniref:DUF6889 family protein n=2 Tax=Serratia fonticola TaxID=47917 RepID=UPI001AE10691|nr:hypothetical protein [Serratia fonticola]
GFFSRSPRERHQYGQAASIATESLPNGRSYLMRPVHANMCKFESLKDGTLTLADIALMNESLDVEAENRYLLKKWQEDNER